MNIFEKILERLEELQNNLLSQTEGDVSVQVGIINGVMYSKKIVQEVAEEYNDGWIMCNERLPEFDDKYYDEHGSLKEYIIVTNGSYAPIVAKFTKSKKWKDKTINIEFKDVIKWQELPEI